jgi:hypothetical protein
MDPEATEALAQLIDQLPFFVTLASAAISLTIWLIGAIRRDRRGRRKAMPQVRSRASEGDYPYTGKTQKL